MKRFVITFVLASLAAAPAWAASESREKQMLRRMQQQVQQIDQARAQAEQDKAAALADKESAERELEKLRVGTRQLAGERAARSRAERELKEAHAELDALKTKLADTEKQLADSVALQHATAQTLAQVESARKQTEGQLAGKAHDLQVCQTHNGQLYTVGREMMQKYRDKSCQDVLAQAEPFTGLKKVEVENMLETWRDRLDREKLSTAGVNP
jgi:chromosome segregation ATPase